MNPKGVNLMDVWDDVPPVRHWKFKSPRRKANALSTKLLDRVIEISTNEGELVLDPFGGSGTTVLAAERAGRVARVIELDPLYVDVAIRRWEQTTGIPARHAELGLTFSETAAKRGATPANSGEPHPYQSDRREET